MSDLTIEKVEKNPEVKQKPERRRFTLEYKRRIAIEAEGCQQPGEIGAHCPYSKASNKGPPNNF